MRFTPEMEAALRDDLLDIQRLYDVHVIVTVCMYCREEYGVKDGEGVAGISHGICPRCFSAKPWERDSKAVIYQPQDRPANDCVPCDVAPSVRPDSSRESVGRADGIRLV